MRFGVLGPFEVMDGDRAVTLGGPMQRSVLALLVLEPNRVVPLNKLIARLWDDGPPARATGTLQAYVSNLRRALEPARRAGEPARLLVRRGSGYLLDVPDEDVDWVRFERLVEQARRARAADELAVAETALGQARAVWRGPFLADLDGLATAERARWQGLRLQAIEDHADVLLALGRHQEALDGLEQVAAEHPLRERLRGLQMVALYRAGRQVEALDVFVEVRRRLAEEHGLDPGTEIRRLHEHILRQDPELDLVRPAPVPVAGDRVRGTVPFVGRVAQRASLRTHLEAAGGASGRVVLVEGEPGIGKTRLAEEVAADATARGFRVVWGRCAEGGGTPPMWPWTQVVRAVDEDRDIAELIPERARTDPRLARGFLNRSLADLLAEWAGVTPLLVVLDDLQWADEASLAALEFLGARLAGSRLLLIGTYREVDLPHTPALAGTLGVLARLPGADRVTLPGLDVDEVGRVIRAYTGAEPASGVAEAVHRRTEGNPFFLVELLRLDEPDSLTAGPVPAGVRDVVRWRVARLPPPTRALLDTAALIGREVDLGLAGRLCGMDAEESAQAADEAVVSGLLTVVPGRPRRYRFAHALVHQTLAADLSPVHRARLHGRVARALLDAHGEDARHAAAIAEHLWASLPVADVVPVLRAQLRAADAAWAHGAYERAETLLDRASGLLRAGPADEAPPDVDLEVPDRLGSLRTARSGYTPAARAAFDRARTLAERLGRGGDLVSVLLGLSATAVVRAELTAAGELNEAALAEAQRAQRATGVAAAYLGIGIVAFYRGDLVTARTRFADARRAWPAAEGQPSGGPHGPPASARPDVMADCYDALAAQMTGDPAGSPVLLARALRAAEAAGEPYLLAFVHSFHARLAVLRREPDIAWAAAGRATAIAAELGFPLLAQHAAVVAGWARARHGEPEAGLADMERALSALDESGQRVLSPFHQGLRAEVLLDLGDAPAALAIISDALAESTARGGGFDADRLHGLRERALARTSAPDQYS